MTGCKALCLLALALLLAHQAAAQGAWKDGRGSYYGNDAWSIHRGSCGYGYQWADIGTGWDVAALADASPEFPGSCGKCFEVKCDPKYLHDGYGNSIDRRTGICYNSSQTVVVRTVDNCPCNYPSNAYSNRRWCCGDNGYTHFDLSVWAFEKLADKKWGVIGLLHRSVPCSYKTGSPAPEPPSPTPGEAPPQGARRPDTLTYTARSDSVGQSQGAVKVVADASQAAGAQVIPYDSLFVGGGAYSVSTNLPSSASSYAASNVLGLGGTPFTTNSASASASASASSNTLASATAAFAAATSSGGSSFASASAIAGTGTPMVVAFGGTSEGGGGGACTDTPLPSNPPYTCQQQKGWGKCNMAEMVKGGYCAQTCGRCTPATTPAATAAPTATPATPAAGNPGSGIVYFKGFQDSWGSWSYSASFAPLYKPGVNGDQANCGAINQFGAFQAGTPAAGRAAGKSALQFWTDGPAAVLTVNLGSQSATCTAKALKDVGASQQQGGFSKYYVPLSSLGCPFGADQVTRVTLASAQQATVNLCISDIRFL